MIRKLWARWFCRWHDRNSGYICGLKAALIHSSYAQIDCPGYKCKGCPLTEAK